MLHKVLILGLAPLGLLAGTSSVSAQSTQGCPFDLRDSGLSPEEIFLICEEWRRSLPPPDRGGGSIDGKPVTRKPVLPSCRITGCGNPL